MYRRLLAGAIAILLALATVSPAVAAPPDSDVWVGREILLDPLPIVVQSDTTEATTDADDAELHAQCPEAPATDATVWYEYTPTLGGELAIDATASDYSVGAIVATGGPGSWSVETCGPEIIPFYAMPGTTYTILVFDDQVDGGGNGGSLFFSISQGPRPPSIEVTVDSRGSFDPHAGTALIAGTYVCAPGDGGVADGSLDVYLTQHAGLVQTDGEGSLEGLQCDGTEQPWTIDIEGSSGLFRGGKAEASVFAEACSTASCGYFEGVQSVKLSAVHP